MTALPPVLFEDDDLIIVDKPAGVVVHPTYRNPGDTLLDALPPGSRIVGRLDRLTSGAVLVAKRADVHAQLQQALAAPEAEKIYLALVRGAADQRGRIDLPLGTDPSDRRRRIVTDGGAPSATEFERLDTGNLDGGIVSLLRCRLLTGRRHQIRVHLSARGWPVVGDAVYGEPLEGFSRLALHAWTLTFVHPRSGERVRVSCTVPAELASLLSRCGLRGDAYAAGAAGAARR